MHMSVYCIAAVCTACCADYIQNLLLASDMHKAVILPYYFW